MSSRPVLLVVLLALFGCSSLPQGLTPVRSFDAARYMGRWYEVARLDHRFERSLTRVTAEYSLREDGLIRVQNRGFDPKRNAWREAIGRAKFAGAPDVGSLRVSFFGPFYAGYHVIALDPEYRWALVAGSSRSYLWILSREPQLDPSTLTALVEKARASGFATGKLVYVEQAF